jgi:hypothetical protein
MMPIQSKQSYNYHSIFFTSQILALMKNVLEYLHHCTDTMMQRQTKCHSYAFLAPGFPRGWRRV